MAVRSGFQLVAITLVSIFFAAPTAAQQVRYETQNGIEYKVIRNEVQVPETTMQSQARTVYRQKLSTDTYQSTHYVTVPVTQYRLVSRMRGRWNPFVTPYWTHHYQPVTTWTQQAATVTVPVNRLAWVPETQTVQTPVTTYRTAVNESRVAVRALPSSASGQQYASNAVPTARLATAPDGQRTASAIGGQQQDDGLPVQGWQRPQPTQSRY